MIGPRVIGIAAAAQIFYAASTVSVAAPFENPEPIEIAGYDGHAMEPELSADGRILIFNNLNDPRENTDLHWAERSAGQSFKYRGKVSGTNTDALEGVPTLDGHGVLYFVSTRSYEQSLATIYRAKFESGRTSEAELVPGLEQTALGMLTFDVAISPDGGVLYGADGRFTGGPVPASADIFVAKRDGGRFRRQDNSADIFANINTSALEFAVAISADGLELFFTRMKGFWFWPTFTIEHAVRPSLEAPFDASQTIRSIEGHVEAPAISRNGKELYYHQKHEGKFRIFRVTRP